MSPRLPWTRRDFLTTAIASTVATFGCSPATGAVRRAGQSPAGAATLRTGLCDLLGIDYPILQAGMAPVAVPELAAAVSNAGGLGILSAAHTAPDEVRARIRRLRDLTDRPFGVNLLLHTEVWPPRDPATFPDSVVQAAQAALNRFRERLGIPASMARPPRRPDHVPGVLEVLIEERVPVFSIGMGNPPKELVERFHAYGAKVVAMVSTPDDARAVAANGVDAVIAQGAEAGGHRSSWVKPPTGQHAAIGTFVLVPEVVDAVDVPVIAAGGVTNGRSIAAALALGASGVLVGTRFVATREARAADYYKDQLVARGSDATVITDAYTGLYARLIRNSYITEYEAANAPVLSGYLQSVMVRDIVAAAAERRDLELYPMWAGQGIGMIHEIPAAADVMESLVQEARRALIGLERRVQDG